MTLFGYDQGVFGGVIVTPDFLRTLDLEGDRHTWLLGTVTALYDVGCFFGTGKTSTVRRLILGAGTQAMQQLSGIKVSHLPTT